MRYSLLILPCAIMLATGVSYVSAMTVQSGSFEQQRVRKGYDRPTGLFGGLKPDGTFVFKLSKDRGVRFYRLAAGVRLSGFPAGQTLQQLAAGTPIRLTVENYRVTVVELLGGEQ